MKTKTLIQLFGLLFCFLIFTTEAFTQRKFKQRHSPIPKETRKGYVFIDGKDKKISKLVFDEAKYFKVGGELTAVKMDGLWGYINKEIEIVISPKYESANSFSGGIGIVQYAGEYYLINKSGEFISKPYELLKESKKHHFLAMKNQKYGMINNEDRLLLDFEFDNIGLYSKDEKIVKKDGTWGYYKNGEFQKSEEEILFKKYYERPMYSEECSNMKDEREGRNCSDKAMLSAIYRNLKYPKEAKRKRIEGIIVVQHTIDKEGNIHNAKVIKGIGGGCDEEALRIVESKLKWFKGATINGELVNISYNTPIKFKIK